ncbi:MAG: 30S ribosomal protein S18 [Candidatus Marinimicrobia bacterium]|nr:30S ribosomal protein S18 [Candidatus Neomarinimicrobiota bacterium]
MAFVNRQKVCKFCENRVIRIDYKDAKILRRFITEQGKIIPRRVTGVCARHQRMLTRSIKRARNIALIHYSLDVTQS